METKEIYLQYFRSIYTTVSNVYEEEHYHDGFFVLPYPDTQNLSWYIVFESEICHRKYYEQLIAFIGPTFTNGFQFITEESFNDIDRTILDKLNFAKIFRFDTCKPDEIIMSIKRMIGILKKTPTISSAERQSIDLLLRNFDIAILGKSDAEALKILNEIENRGELSFENIAFLKIQILELLQNYHKIYSLGKELLYYPFPSRTQSVFLISCFHVHIKFAADSNNPNEAITKFNEQLKRQEYQPLFNNFLNYEQPEILILFTLNELSKSTFFKTTYEKFDNLFPKSSSYYSFFKNLLSGCNNLRSINYNDLQNEIKLLQESCEYQKALDILYENELNIELLKSLLDITQEYEKPKYYSKTKEKVNNCPIIVRDAVLNLLKYQKLWELIKSKKEISNWNDWLELLNENDSQVDSALVKVADEIDFSFDKSYYLNNPGLCNRISEMIIDKCTSKTLEVMLQKIVNCFIKDGESNKEFLNIYKSILEVLSLKPSGNVLLLIDSLFEALLEIIDTKKDYSDVLGYIKDIWEQLNSIEYMLWFLEILNSLSLKPCYDKAKKDDLFNSMIGFAGIHSHRLSQDHFEIIELLCSDYKLPIEQLNWFKRYDLENDTTINCYQQNLDDSLKSMKVGIYSLLEPVLNRVKNYLEKKFKGISVTINNDHAATDKLKSLAQNSDIILFAGNAAKHQAYYCVKANAIKEKIVMVHGKGSSSVISALISHVLKLKQV